MSTRKTSVVYWTLTGLFCLLQGWAAVQYLIEAPRMMQSIQPLGYPVYFLKLLGVAKLLGIAAILHGGFPRLKEWAYAGFTFDTVLAFLSHLAAGESLLIATVPLLFCAAQLGSYFLWDRKGKERPIHAARSHAGTHDDGTNRRGSPCASDLSAPRSPLCHRPDEARSARAGRERAGGFVIPTEPCIDRWPGEVARNRVARNEVASRRGCSRYTAPMYCQEC